jgi:predicted small secreted protein
MSNAVKVLVSCALLGAMVALSACNTAKGVGRDVEAAGEAVQDAAD